MTFLSTFKILGFFGFAYVCNAFLKISVAFPTNFAYFSLFLLFGSVCDIVQTTAFSHSSIVYRQHRPFIVHKAARIRIHTVNLKI